MKWVNTVTYQAELLDYLEYKTAFEKDEYDAITIWSNERKLNYL